MAEALRHADQEGQLAFFEEALSPAPARQVPARPSVARHAAPLCAGCRAKEARYGFRQSDDDPTIDRPRTLCFECFRVELTYRQAISARLARGWNASQVALPLENTLAELTHRRRRAQIAARKALEIR
jgi:hypothetical protein